MTKHKSKFRGHSTDKVRNLKSFINAYLLGENGRKALNRGPSRDKWGNAAMAVAFQKAVA